MILLKELKIIYLQNYYLFFKKYNLNQDNLMLKKVIYFQLELHI